MKIRHNLILCCVTWLTACGSSSNPNLAAINARYKVTFNATWDNSNFPTNYPSNSHFSGLIGATHNNSVSFWSTAVKASAGIQQVAETGSKSTFNTELGLARTAGAVEFILNGNGIGSSPGNTSFEFDINQDFPLVTLISMIAPSPDWFVGVHDERLFDQTNYQWVSSKTVELKAYDSGTDSGVSFASPDSVTTPAIGIALVTSAVADTDLNNGVQRDTMESMATFTFERINDPIQD